MFPADFGIGDLTDDPHDMIPSFNESDEIDLEEIENDIPGFALDPEDFLTSEDPEYDRLQTPMYEDDPITALIKAWKKTHF